MKQGESSSFNGKESTSVMLSVMMRQWGERSRSRWGKGPRKSKSAVAKNILRTIMPTSIPYSFSNLAKIYQNHKFTPLELLLVHMKIKGFNAIPGQRDENEK